MCLSVPSEIEVEVTDLVFLVDIVSPYRISIYDALGRQGVDYHIVALSHYDRMREWTSTVPPDLPITVLSHLPLSQRFALRGRRPVHFSWGLRQALRRHRPERTIIGGWNQPSFLQAAFSSSSIVGEVWLWVESNADDLRPPSRSAARIKEIILGRAHGCFVPGEKSETYLRSLGFGGPIAVAPNCVDVQKFRNAASSLDSEEVETARALTGTNRVYAFVGRPTWAKGIDVALGMMLKDPDSGFIVLGDSGETAHWQAEAELLRVDDRIHFAGFHNEQEVIRVLAAADLLVFPSRSDTWGLVVNEALAVGTPVVASESAGVSAAVARFGAGAVVQGYDPDDWVSAAESLVADPSSYESAVSGAAGFSRHHHPDVTASSLSGSLCA